MPVKGVDISESNGRVDFQALKRAGVEFVLIRCGYGGDYIDQDDERFFENVRKAKAAGMPYGIYLYSYALNVAQAVGEADHALRILSRIGKPAYGVWFDMEDADHYKERHGMPSNGTLVEICLTFLQRVEAAGYYTGLYASLSWLNGQLNDPRLDKYDKWVAQWNRTCDYKKSYGIWQYTDCWVIDGKNFDGNLAYKDYPALTGNKKEDDDMVTYKQLKDVPGSYQPTIRKLMERGALAGKKDPDPNSLEDNILDVEEVYCRVMTTLDRLGKLD